MLRILGIDYGEKRIGLALSDPFGWTAQPFSTVAVKTERQAFAEIESVIREYEVSIVVLGLPIQMNGIEGIQAEKVRKFAARLAAFLQKNACEPMPKIDFIDERLSTAGAERVLIEADLSRRHRRQVIDKQAASFMLQGYLDLHRELFVGNYD